MRMLAADFVPTRMGGGHITGHRMWHSKEGTMPKTQSFRFVAPFARRLPDPVFSNDYRMERHVLFVPVRSVPGGLPLDPNARIPNIRRQVYREVERSLLNEEGFPNTFHLKHKGITLVAEDVVKTGDDEYDVLMSDGHGILDGGHTYALLTKERDFELPEEQFVKFEILTRVPDKWIAELSAGLNTSVQVQSYSIDELEGLFEWIKVTLKQQPYYGQLAWKEGEEGSYSIKDLIGIFTLFHIGFFPNDGDSHPIEGYEKKAKALKRFEDDQKDKVYLYQKLRPLLHEILVLHDIIRRDAQEPYNKAGGRYGKLAFVEKRKKGHFEFPFTGQSSEYRLMNGALYPILGAFRWMVEEDPQTDEYRWRGGFENVLNLWEDSAVELMRLTLQTSLEQGRNADSIGKSRSHWSNLHSQVAKKDLMARVK